MTNHQDGISEEKKEELEMIFRMILEVNDSIKRCGITDMDGMWKLYERNMDFKLHRDFSKSN